MNKDPVGEGKSGRLCSSVCVCVPVSSVALFIMCVCVCDCVRGVMVVERLLV